MSKPACFDSETQWSDYQREAKASGWPADRFCRDCSPEYRNQMIRAARCAHPETVFIVGKQTEGVFGLTASDPRYVAALTGKYESKRAAVKAIVPASREVMEQINQQGEQ